jgi:membrane glycosyltransferase
MLMLIGIAIPLFQEGIDFNAVLHLAPGVYWRAQDEQQVVRLFAATMAVLLMPKVLGYLAMLLDPVDRRGCGGAFRAFVSMLVETVLAALMAPVVIGMVLAIPVVALTSSRGPGAFLHRLGLLDIPEENIPPPVLVRAAQLRREAAEQPPLY